MMKRATLIAVILAATAAFGFSLAREQGDAKARTGDDQAIRANVEAFAQAFDKHDAEAIAKLFVPDGKLITEEGEVIEGHKAIVAAFAAQFADNPEATIRVTVDSIKFIGSDFAVEVGSTKMTPGPGLEPELDRYKVIHVKRDGKWLMAVAADSEGPAQSPHQRLHSLEWLVGDWVDESPDGVVTTSCRWSADRNYLLQDIQVLSSGKVTMTIHQRITWDAVQKCVHAWVFDSEGGFGESLWTRDGEGWIIKATGVRTDGSTASATNTVTRTGKDTYTWRSTDRVIGGAASSPVEVRVARKPPAANAAKN